MEITHGVESDQRWGDCSGGMDRFRGVKANRIQRARERVGGVESD